MSDAQQIVNLANRIGRLEQMVRHLYDYLGIEPPPSADPATHASPEIVALIRGGDTIGAIKQMRSETGCDLSTAKERVEALAGQAL